MIQEVVHLTYTEAHFESNCHIYIYYTCIYLLFRRSPCTVILAVMVLSFVCNVSGFIHVYIHYTVCTVLTLNTYKSVQCASVFLSILCVHVHEHVNAPLILCRLTGRAPNKGKHINNDWNTSETKLPLH